MEKIKKGEMTSKTLVTIIILIIGFVVVLFFYFQLKGEQRADREACHQSVIYRATLPTIAKSYVPLKCKTQKICFTTGGGACEDFANTKRVTKIKVKKGDEGETQIERAISQEIVECWKMMGEGKVSVFTNWLAETYGIGSVGSSCIICSRIAFDKENLEKSEINLKEIDVMKYMMTHAVPDKDISYYGYIAGEGGLISVKDDIQIIDIDEVKTDDGTELKLGNNLNIDLEDVPQEAADTEELAVVFMQVSAPSHTGVIKNTLSTLGIGYGVSFGLAPKIIGKTAVAALKSPWTWIAIAIAGAYQQGSVAYNRAITAGYCGDVSSGGEERDGCSVVRTINYNIEDISKYCSVVESIP